MIRNLHFHFGHDVTGSPRTRLRSAPEQRRERERRRLQPRVVLVIACAPGQPVWRNGLHRRRWLEVSEAARGDRRCFLMTLSRPPLIVPVRPF